MLRKSAQYSGHLIHILTLPSLCQGWEAVSRGIPLEEYAGNYAELWHGVET